MTHEPLSQLDCRNFWIQEPDLDELHIELQNAPKTLMLLRVLSAEYLQHGNQGDMDAMECISILAGDV